MVRLYLNNVFRLGSARRNARDYSAHMRRHGKSPFERMTEKHMMNLKNKCMMLTMESFEQEMNVGVLTAQEEDEKEVFLLSSIYFHKSHKILNTPCLMPPDVITKKKIKIDSFSEQELMDRTGFNGFQVGELMRCMKIPDFFKLGEGEVVALFIRCD